MKFATRELRTVTILAGLPEWQLAWFAEHGDKIELAQGGRMFERGHPADFMFIVVKGTIKRYEEVAGQWLVVATTRQGQVTGMLPYSRMTHYPGYTVATEPSEVLRLRKDYFREMLLVSQEIGRRLVAVMADRVRGDVRLEQQQDRMMALGRLSAGLAHELNNPAAAVRRTAANLSSTLDRTSSLVLSLIRHPADEQAIETISRLHERVLEDGVATGSALEQSEREENLVAWLEPLGLDDPEDAAAAFVDAGVTTADLDEFVARVPAAIASEAITWIASQAASRRMLAAVASSATRISDLVAAVKTYSQMDRSPEHKPTDVRGGLESTLTMLSHRLKQKGLRVRCAYQEELPLILGNQGELNQVWTNLIDNAIDAMDEGGTLAIEARHEDVWLAVRVIDDGHGIPDEVLEQIFEPFFTTKTAGQGTGLGLDIALRIVRVHQGNLEVQSTPGRTEICVRLPTVHM